MRTLRRVLLALLLLLMALGPRPGRAEEFRIPGLDRIPDSVPRV